MMRQEVYEGYNSKIKQIQLAQKRQKIKKLLIKKIQIMLI
jgi:hypothetical protein